MSIHFHNLKPPFTSISITKKGEHWNASLWTDDGNPEIGSAKLVGQLVFGTETETRQLIDLIKEEQSCVVASAGKNLTTKWLKFHNITTRVVVDEYFRIWRRDDIIAKCQLGTENKPLYSWIDNLSTKLEE